MQSRTVATDASEYSLYTRPVVNAHLQFVGAQAGDTVSVSVLRLDGYGTLPSLTQAVTLAGGQTSADVAFSLPQATTPPGSPPQGELSININWAASGDYAVQATATGVAAPALSPTFAVSLVTADELRQQWIKGVPLQALDVIAPVMQPQVVTGVTIQQVSQGMPQGVHTLALASGSPATLSFDGGAPVAVPTTRAQVPLVTADQHAYIVAEVVPWLLPSAPASETILMTGAQFTDADLRRYVRYAVANLESAFYFFLEPRVVSTEPVMAQAQRALFVDQAVQAPTYVQPRDFAHWMSFQLPTKRPLEMYYLQGWFNGSQAVSIGNDWIVFDQLTGTLELVPDNGAVISWQFYGAAILQFFLNYQTIPGFWHFAYAAGIPSLNLDYAVLREAIAKKAASDILSAAGFAYTAGTSSRSTSRDGVSTSRSYAGKQGGDALRAQYMEWLAANVPRLKTRFGGLNVGIL